jgi:hypothetical protein
MCKKLKDGLKEVIKIGKKEFHSIYEALFYDYQMFKIYKEGEISGTYRGKMIMLEIQNEEIVDDESIQDTDRLYSNIKKQIDSINEELDGE